MLNYAVSLYRRSTDEEGQVQSLSVLGVNFITFISGSSVLDPGFDRIQGSGLDQINMAVDVLFWYSSVHRTVVTFYKVQQNAVYI